MDQRQGEIAANNAQGGLHGDLQGTAEVAFLHQRIRAADLPEHALAAAEYEIQRLGNLTSASPQYGVSRVYLDWLLALPWHARTEDDLQIDRVRKRLDSGHHGLEFAKAQILDFVGAMKLRGGGYAPALCFVGPHGAGKTSLGHSIARALGRKFVSVSLAGVNDEAEVLGRRRTWLDALPGRVMRAMRTAGVNNPVFMLEGIDEFSAGGKGDLTASLAEVIDSKLRARFTDHYLDLPFDLTEVLFIATAHLEEAIPEALRESVDMIRLPGYVPEEKYEIARGYLIPRERERYGLEAAGFDLDEWSLRKLIGQYTSEAGVRELQERISALVRRAAYQIADGECTRVQAGESYLAELFGPPSQSGESAHRRPEVGAAQTLMIASEGGTVSVVEVTRIRGAGEVTVTGPVDDTVRECVLTVLTSIRARAERFDLKPEVFDQTHLHVHFNAAPAPSDMASHSLAIAAALVSAYTGKPVRFDLALTGGLSLRGKVLPVDGLVDKILAARRAEIQHVVFPAENAAEIQKLPKYVRDAMEFHPVQTVDRVLELATLQIIVPKPEETSAIEMFQKGQGGSATNGG